MRLSAVVVSGASTGIGRACALHLDRIGFTVFAGVRRPEDADALRGETSDRLRAVTLDVTDPEQIARVVSDVRAAGLPVAGIVNNAGIAVSGPTEFVPLDDWRRQFEVNVLGAVAMIQGFLPLLRQSRGRIVNVSSIGGRFAQPMVAPYVASKHAIEAISDALRVELRPWEINVALIEPGSVATPIWEKGVRAGATMLGSAPEGLTALYGRAINVAIATAKRESERGVAPERVARSVAHALIASRPRTRYVVGRDAHAMLLVKRVLPDRLRDALILRIGGLPRRAGDVAAYEN